MDNNRFANEYRLHKDTLHMTLLPFDVIPEMAGIPEFSAVQHPKRLCVGYRLDECHTFLQGHVENSRGQHVSHSRISADDRHGLESIGRVKRIRIYDMVIVRPPYISHISAGDDQRRRHPGYGVHCCLFRGRGSGCPHSKAFLRSL